MQTANVLLIILAAILALAISLYQYYYRSPKSPKFKVVLAFLRGIALFGIGLLLINPKFTRNEYLLEKANLVLLLDNSSSLSATPQKEQLAQISAQFQSDINIASNFRYRAYSFGNYLNNSDSLTHGEKATNISKALASIRDIYSNTPTAVVMVTDGNQTLGEDYEFYGRNQENPIYPVVLGDTTQYADISIDQLNTNKYAFLKNKFPVEVFVSYRGDAKATTNFTLSVAGKTVYREQLNFSNTVNALTINTLIEANTVGVKEIKVKLSPLTGERNQANNQRVTAVEVIDEKTTIAIVSEILHPDIGALKNAIESNEQREVSVVKPRTPTAGLKDIDLFILYQPSASFKPIYDYISSKGAAKFTITGTETDWNFLNRIQNSFTKESFNQTEDISPVLNAGFGTFEVSDFSIDDFPPLEGYLGDILITKPFETILGQQIKGVAIEEPLLSVIGNDLEKEAVLFAENIWKWRAQTFRNDQEFKNFDDLIGKIILYIATKEPKSRLSLDYQKTYQGINEASIAASYFDETFVFDSNASIILALRNKANSNRIEIPMLLMNNYYKADLGNLPPGEYAFTVSVANENISKSGNFTLLDYDVEKQFFSSNYRKLEQLATATKGALFYPDETEQLIANLLADSQFVPTQKSNENVVSLVDFRVLLGIIVLALAAEWFIRKYNGLI